MLDDIQKRILDRMHPGIRYARADLMADDDLDLSPALWKQAMAQLVEMDKVTRTGQKRGTRYHISGYPVTSDTPPPPPPAAPAEPKPIPTPGIVMRRSASSDILSDADLGLRRRVADPSPRRAQEPPPVLGTGLRSQASFTPTHPTAAILLDTDTPSGLTPPDLAVPPPPCRAW